MKHVATLTLGLSTALLNRTAQAQPEQPPAYQWNTALALGAASYGDQNDLWRATRFVASAHADLFFGRTGNHSFGFGPALSAGFSSYNEANLGLGAQLIIPVHEVLPIVVGLGLYGVDREGQSARPGGFARLGWGLRSFNYHSPYALAGGLLLEARRDFSEAPTTTWLASIQVDAAALALPFVWALNALR